MLKLNAALGGWSPGEGQPMPGTDPLMLLAAGWPEFVGEDVARNCHPTAINGDALVVTTRSSAWSQQLSYLVDPILSAIRARLPKAGIEKLRFRIGKVPERRSLSAPDRVLGRAAAPQARPPAADASEALGRLRDDLEAAERAKRASGWKECSGCTALIAPASGPLCAPCQVARNDERERLVSRLLYEAPWLGFAGTAALIEGLSRDEYEGIRQRLLMHWWDRLSRARWQKSLSRDGSERMLASSYVLLKTELAPERISPATVRNVLGDELHDLLYGTEHRK